MKVILLLFAAILCAGCGGGSLSPTAKDDLVRSAPGDAEVQGIVEGWLAHFVPFNPYFGTAEAPPPYGMSQCRFTHGPIQVRRIDDSLLEAEFDYSGKVTFSNVPEWEETAAGRVVLEIVPVAGRWMTNLSSHAVHSSEVFGRPSDGPIPSLQITDLQGDGEGGLENLMAWAPISIRFEVSGITPEWESNVFGTASISPNQPVRSGNMFSVDSTPAPEKLGRYWVEVSAGSWKPVEGCILPIGTRASRSLLFTVTRPWVPVQTPPGEEPPGGDPPPPPGP